METKLDKLRRLLENTDEDTRKVLAELIDNLVYEQKRNDEMLERISNQISNLFSLVSP